MKRSNRKRFPILLSLNVIFEAATALAKEAVVVATALAKEKRHRL